MIATGAFTIGGIASALYLIKSRHPDAGGYLAYRDHPVHKQLVAVDLDSGEAVRFGAPGWDDVPISQAVQASAALPGLYPPDDANKARYEAWKK